MDEIIKYSTEGLDNLEVRIGEETVWLTQAQISKLFGTDRTSITRHITNIYSSQELDENSTCAKIAHVGNKGKQTYHTTYYNLDVVLSIGYRVSSKRATRFRIWATKVLKEHLLKGYTVKQPATVEQLQELRAEIEQILERQDKMDAFMFEEFGQVYALLTELASQKKLQEEQQPRRKIGFQHYLEPKS